MNIMKHREGGSAGMRAGWEVKSLGEVCEIIGGGTPSKDKPEFYNGEILWATVRDMKHEFISETEFHITQDAVNKSATNIIPAGNVVIATRVGLGKVCIVEQDTAINQDLRGVIPIDSNKLFIRYLFWWFKITADVIVAEGTGATVQGVKLPFIKSLQIPLPPLAEQQRIVAILDEAFEGIATARKHAEQNLLNAKALFESHLYKNHTEKTLLGHIVNIKTGKLDANAATVDGLYPFFTCSRETYRTDTYAFDCEAILLAGNNAVGDFNVKHYLGRFNAYQRTYVITAIDDTKVHNRFLYFQILKGLKKFKSQSVGSGTKFLKLDMIKELDIELPTIAEQINITASLDALRDETNRLCDIYTQKIAALDALKKSLLHQAFSGEL